MTNCFTFGGRDLATPVLLVNSASYTRLKKKLAPEQLQWLEQNDFAARNGQLCGLPAPDGTVARFLVGVADVEDPFAVADLPTRLPPGLYSLEGTGVKANFTSLAIGCLLYTSPSPRDQRGSRMPSSA